METKELHEFAKWLPEHYNVEECEYYSVETGDNISFEAIINRFLDENKGE